jgi:CheY-like chemotaxis protein
MHKTILIAEDYDDTRSFMKFMLETFGYKVLEASNGQEAVEKVKHHFPDLILMDMAMPVMDGLTATRIIRKSQDKNKMPIIAITAHGKEFYNRAIEAGCNHLINKPIEINDLEPLISQYLGH